MRGLGSGRRGDLVEPALGAAEGAPRQNKLAAVRLPISDLRFRRQLCRTFRGSGWEPPANSTVSNRLLRSAIHKPIAETAIDPRGGWAS